MQSHFTEVGVVFFDFNKDWDADWAISASNFA